MIDEWFLYKLKNLADYEKQIKNSPISKEQYIYGKKLGYTDSALEKLSGGSLAFHRDAVYKMVDTCGAEFAAETPYFYSTYDTVCESKALQRNEDKKRIIDFRIRSYPNRTRH